MKLQEKIKELEYEILKLKSKVANLSENTESKPMTPYSKVGKSSRALIHPKDSKSMIDTKTGGHIIWNDTEESQPYTEMPQIPSIGYNRHTHSRYSGGALIVNGLELVEYETKEFIVGGSDENPVVNYHTQQFLQADPKVATVKAIIDGKEKKVEKIGLMDITFNPLTGKWGTSSTEIDVETTYLVKRVKKAIPAEGDQPAQAVGAIEKDSKGQEMKAPLLYTAGDEETLAGRNENLNKSNVWWDEGAKTWRFYASFKQAPEEEQAEEPEE